MRAQLRDRPLLRDRYERLYRQQTMASEEAVRSRPEARTLETAWKNSEKDK